MNVLIIGSGAREYALGLAFTKDRNCDKIYFAPGNGATTKLGENLAITDYDQLSDFAISNQVELTVVGSEEPLTKGIVDLFRAKNLTIFGPTQAAARLEGSKSFMKNFLARHKIPTARYTETDDPKVAADFIETLNAPIVVKADGLCAGKGVIIAQTREDARAAASDMLSGESFGSAGRRVVIEEFLDGFELSVFAITDGESFVTLPACQDHKRLLTGDLGPNTGGMGAYAPTPLANSLLIKKIEDRVIAPTIAGMKSEGTPFEGVLFCGIMVVRGEPYTLEFNVRFGDPECEELMALLETPATELFFKAASGRLGEVTPRFSAKTAVGVVIASRSYPYNTSKPAPIVVEDGAENENAHIAYAGVTNDGDRLMASGGRVMVCVGLGDSVATARNNAYDLVKKVHFDGMQFREDIAYQALI
ncbi:phosphoribosylamine--glycine ligase [Campylobacterota bacterium]|nr:phosphoribosylamine--glycine ligase [Campylobacterota bacterium]